MENQEVYQITNLKEKYLINIKLFNQKKFTLFFQKQYSFIGFTFDYSYRKKQIMKSEIINYIMNMKLVIIKLKKIKYFLPKIKKLLNGEDNGFIYNNKVFANQITKSNIFFAKRYYSENINIFCKIANYKVYEIIHL